MDCKKIRNLYGLSQNELSKITKIPLRTIQCWECGQREPSDYMENLILTKLRVEFNNLQLITHQESGIVLYGNNLIVCNWSFFVNGGLPSVSPLGEVWVSTPKPLIVNAKSHTDSVYNLVKDCEILSDKNDDIAKLADNDCAGDVYEITDGNNTVTVIAPQGWC